MLSRWRMEYIAAASGAVAAGLLFVVAHAVLPDDAYITLNYARNLAAVGVDDRTGDLSWGHCVGGGGPLCGGWAPAGHWGVVRVGGADPSRLGRARRSVGARACRLAAVGPGGGGGRCGGAAMARVRLGPAGGGPAGHGSGQ